MVADIAGSDGEVKWVSATGYSVELSGGEQRFVGIVEDITDRKRREQRLEVLNRVLRHNLRNQIDVIRSHAEVLGEGVERRHSLQRRARCRSTVDGRAARNFLTWISSLRCPTEPVSVVSSAAPRWPVARSAS